MAFSFKENLNFVENSPCSTRDQFMAGIGMRVKISEVK